MAHITDYDVWHTSAAPVTVELVIRTLRKNTTLAQEAVRHLVRNLPPQRDCGCARALADALITVPAVIPAATRDKLNLIAGKYLANSD
jgi:5'-methylthioadenosine phosphorylase